MFRFKIKSQDSNVESQDILGFSAWRKIILFVNSITFSIYIVKYFIKNYRYNQSCGPRRDKNPRFRVLNFKTSAFHLFKWSRLIMRSLPEYVTEIWCSVNLSLVVFVLCCLSSRLQQEFVIYSSWLPNSSILTEDYYC